jgi:O-antigen/teichoic acid export membrane protein
MYIVCSLIPIKIVLNIILIDIYGVYGLAISSVLVIFLHSFGNFMLLNYYKTDIKLKFYDLVKLITNLIAITLIAIAAKTFFTTSLVFIFSAMTVLFIINIFIGLILGMRYTNFLKT